MKTQKLLCLDIEVADELKKIPNASKLVNSLLLEYFYSGAGLEKEQIKDNIDKLDREIVEKNRLKESLKEKVKELERKEKEMKEKFKNIPFVILQDFKEFPLMTEEALLSRYNSDYFGSVEWDELLVAYKEYFKK